MRTADDGLGGEPVAAGDQSLAADGTKPAADGAAGLMRHTVRPARLASLLDVQQRRRRRDRERVATTEAVSLERLRIAADVHDLILQDLAFALANARMISAGVGDASAAEAVVASCERALAAGRSLLAGLSGHDGAPVQQTLERAVHLAARGSDISFSGDGVAEGTQPDRATRDALVHIAREAVTNAVKHGPPASVAVVLEHADEWRLRVSDDGPGFEDMARRGFGVDSMRRHAEALGGWLRIRTTAGGTIVEAGLP